jgi:glutathione S-transferase
MILVGRNLSPFVRRTATVLKHLGLEYEAKGLSTADDMAEIGKTNPVMRVPSLILDDGEVLIDSGAIIDHLNEHAPADKKLIPDGGGARRDVLRLTAIAHGAAEKGVASAYERGRRPEDKVWQDWVDMVEGQVAGGLAALDEAAAGGGWLVGDTMTLADVTAVAAYDFIAVVARNVVADGGYPNLKALSERANALPCFAETHPKPA